MIMKEKRSFSSKSPPGGERGQGLVEYALILVLVAVVVVAALSILGPVAGNVFSRVTDALLDPGGSGPITGVSVTRSGTSVHVFVTVSRSTAVTVSLQSQSKTETFDGTYEFVFGSVVGCGTGTVTAGSHSKSFDF